MRIGYLNLGPRHQSQLPLGHDLLAGSEAFFDHHIVADAHPRHHRPGLHTHVRLHHIDELAVLPDLDGHRRDDDGVAAGGQGQGCHDELAGPEETVLVGEGPLEQHGACLGVHLVVQKAQRSSFGPHFALRDVGFHPQGAGRHVSLDLGQILLGNGKAHVDRHDLHDLHHAALVVVGLDLGPLVHEQASGPAGHRGFDVAVFQIQLRALQGRAVGRRCCPQRLGIGAELFELVAADVVLGGQLGIAPGVELRLVGQGRVALEPGPGLLHGGFVRARIDREEQVPLLDVLALPEMNFHQFAVYPRFNRDRRIGLHRPHRLQLDRHRFLHGGSRLHRYECFTFFTLRGPLAAGHEDHGHGAGDQDYGYSQTFQSGCARLQPNCGRSYKDAFQGVFQPARGIELSS